MRNIFSILSTVREITCTILIAILGIFGCASPKLEPLDFVDTTILSLEFENFNAVHLQGQVIRQGSSADGECGFLWAYDRVTVEDLKPEAQRISLSLPLVGGDGSFEASLGDLELGRSIYVRSFVTIRDENAGERKIFSAKTASFTVGEIVETLDNTLIINDSAVVFGRLLGIFNAGISVTQYGHVLAKTSILPTLGCSDCSVSENGSSSADIPFSSGFGGLEFNTNYHVRAYAISGSDTFYSKTLAAFRVRDGWELVSKFPSPYAEGTAATIGGKAYAGFGCLKGNGCTQADLSPDFWQFDPTALNGYGEWTPAIELPVNFTKQYNNASFVLDGKFHAIGGIVGILNSLQSNLIYFDPITQGWAQDFDALAMGRTGAVAFTLKGKAYVGAGLDMSNNELNDFWEYDPTTGQWRPVASMPLQRNPSNPVETNIGRNEAVAFTIQDEYAYVGSGQYNNISLRDFWRFQPPANNQEVGKWKKMAFLPPEAPGRFQAVAFSIGDKGYLGTGYSQTEGYLSDWWQYDPNQNKWFAKTSFPAGTRTNAMGFAIDKQGYLGTGQTKIPINNGTDYTEYTFSDFWRYVPEE